MRWSEVSLRVRTLGPMLCLVAVFTGLAPAWAQENPLAPGWDLAPGASVLRFQSVKKSTVVESSSFASLSGTIAADGTATVEVLLDSVDTKIDLRNVRMRFLFFETFTYPMASVSLRIDPAMIADLATVRRKVITVPYALDLHGIRNDLVAELAVTLLDENTVSVASSTPISISFADFGLQDNIAKLEEAANVVIVPSATVTFDFTFTRRGGARAAAVVAAEPAALPAVVALPAASDQPAAAALETQGIFSREECVGRLEILSRTGNIFFRTASARLDEKSRFLLVALSDIVTRCPDLVIEVAGHTDDVGGDAQNQALSDARARSVVAYLAEKGVVADRLRPVGYGEARPIAGNGTPDGRARNRRIEFAAVN